MHGRAEHNVADAAARRHELRPNEHVMVNRTSVRRYHVFDERDAAPVVSRSNAIERHVLRAQIDPRDARQPGITAETPREFACRLAPEAKCRQRHGGTRRQHGQNAHLERELLLDVRALREPKDPAVVHVERPAVTPLAEQGDPDGCERGERGLDDAGRGAT
jgi:hypothetical protein